MIDRLHLGVGELGGKLVEIDVVVMHQRVDLAEGEQIVLLRQAEQVVHRMRPEHAAARQVPIPQAAAAAIERGVDAAAHRVMDDIGFAGAGCLPVKGKAEDQHDEAGRGRERDRQRGGGAPARQRIVAALDDGDEADRIFQGAHRGESRVAVGERDLAGAGDLAAGGERLQGTEHFGKRPSEHLRRVRRCGDDRTASIGDEDAAADTRGPGRQRPFDGVGAADNVQRSFAGRTVKFGGEVIG